MPALLALAVCAGAAEKKISNISGELTLERAVTVAVRQNPDILQAKKEIERTRGQVIEVTAQALPNVGLSANYHQEDKYLLESSSRGTSFSASDPVNGSFSFGNVSNQLNVGGDKTWRILIEARQVLYSGGQVKAAQKIARLTEDQSVHLLRDIVERVIAQTRAQFYSVLLNRKLIDVAEQNIRLLEDELNDQRNRFDAGTVPKFNVLRAEVAVANARPAVIRSKNATVIAELELAKTLGLDAARTPSGRPAFHAAGQLRASPRTLNLSRALAIARQRRASLKAQRDNILIGEQQVTVAKSGYKPRLDASTGWEFRNSRRTDDVSQEVNGWYFGITGSWSIFDGYETKGKILQAGAKLDSARIAYDDAVQLVELEVQKAYARVLEAKALISSQGKVIEQADEALRLARERLSAGAGTQLEVLDAQFALTRSRTTEQEALYDYNVAIAEFDRATGADTVFDDTFKDPAIEKAKAKLRKGPAVLRAED